MVSFWLAEGQAPLGTLDRTGGSAGCGSPGAEDQRARECSRSADMTASALECCSGVCVPSGRQRLTVVDFGVYNHPCPVQGTVRGMKFMIRFRSRQA